MGEGQGERDERVGLRFLARRLPWLAPASLALSPVGLLGGYGWMRLGHGRLHSFEYWCCLLTLLSALVALLGPAVWVQLRSPSLACRRWAARLSGCLIFAGILLVLYLAAQGICWRLNTRDAARSVREGSHSDGTSYQASRILGHMPKRNVTSGARLVVDGEEVFNYTYHTDGFRRRITPDMVPNPARQCAVVFFGDSYTFGEGVSDAETLPNQLAVCRPDLGVYNYAFSGYGPNHMLARLEALDTRAEIAEPSVIGVYVFIPNHVRRVIGAFSVNSWSRHSPWYVLGEDGLPRRLGSFQGERPGLTRWYDFLKGDHVIQRFALDFPLRLNDRHHALTAAIIAKAAELFRSQFQGGDFYVVLYPENPVDEFPARMMGERLTARGLQVLDYSALLPGPPERYFYVPEDSHPRAAAHALVAARLAQDLAHFKPLKAP